jgi:RHS repeat-associated protein
MFIMPGQQSLHRRLYAVYHRTKLMCPPSGTLNTDEKFTGQRLDQDGLYYYGARYYDASIGRFISADTTVPDPANPQALNRYSYCYNNPLKYVDPSGHTPEEQADIARLRAEAQTIVYVTLQYGSALPAAQRSANFAQASALNTQADALETAMLDREAAEQQNGGTTAGTVLATGGAVCVALVGDDFVTGGVGVIDDVLIPLVVVGTAAVATGLWIRDTFLSRAQDKKLSPGEQQKLDEKLREEQGETSHELKNRMGCPNGDFYKQPNGDIILKPKCGGPGEEIGCNAKELW